MNALLLLAVLLSQADDPRSALPIQDRAAALARATDAPLSVKAGQLVPYDGVLLTPAEDVRRVKGREKCEATLETAKGEGVLLSPPKVVLIILAAVATGAAVTAAGFELRDALRPKP